LCIKEYIVLHIYLDNDSLGLKKKVVHPTQV